MKNNLSILATRNLQNYWMIAFLKGVLQKEEPGRDPMIQVNVWWIQGDLHPREELTEAMDFSDVVLALCPLKKNALQSTQYELSQNNSFLIHMSTFGEEIRELAGDYPNIISYADDTLTPIEYLPNLFSRLASVYREGRKDRWDRSLNRSLNSAELSEGGIPLVLQRVAKYNRYELEPEEEGKLGTLSLVELGNFYGPDLKMVCILEENTHLYPLDELEEFTVIDNFLYGYYKGLTDVLNRKRDEYIVRALKAARQGMVTHKDGSSSLLIMVYAENHVNEIAHKAIEMYNQAGYNQVLVFVGEHTRNNDLFSIRGSGFDIGKIARSLGGNGKEKAGTAFLDTTTDLFFDALTEEIEETLNK